MIKNVNGSIIIPIIKVCRAAIFTWLTIGYGGGQNNIFTEFCKN
jgi:hypothetical protein